MLDPLGTFSAFQAAGIRFWTGVPDSLLKDFCAVVSDRAESNAHVIAANEGNAVGIAAGHYLASRSPAVVYMQNSGLGNAVNPLVSLASSAVYGIPMVLLIGWRGEPGTVDEPQHMLQGSGTQAMLDAAEIPHAILSTDQLTAETQISAAVERSMGVSQPIALIVRAGSFSTYEPTTLTHDDEPVLTREAAVQLVAASVPAEGAIVATTGKASRELFEYRAAQGAGHHQDFLTVGSMGHAAQIALGINLGDPQRPVVVLDGDGALLMHMGSLAVIGQHAGPTFKHVVINNQAHDSVGGQPTPTTRLDIPQLAKASGYRFAAAADTTESALQGLATLMDVQGPALLEIRTRIGSRTDLGRPTTTPAENKQALMDHLAR